MKCPACPDTNLVMSERQGVEIDYCPDCRGVWLDRGELDKIIERSSAYGSAPEPVQQPIQQHGRSLHKDHYRHAHDSGHHYRKKKSFFEELFD